MKKYLVRLGFVEVVIEGRSKEEAIRLARTELSDDMPRLYDMIHSADLIRDAMKRNNGMFPKHNSFIERAE